MKPTKHLGRKRPVKHLTDAEREARFATVAGKVKDRVAGRAHAAHPAHPTQADVRARALGIARRVRADAKTG